MKKAKYSNSKKKSYIYIIVTSNCFLFSPLVLSHTHGVFVFLVYFKLNVSNNFTIKPS